MNSKRTLLLLLMIAFALSWTSSLSAQSDSLTLARSRVVRWAVNHALADTIIGEQKDKLEAAKGAIRYLQNELTKDSTAIEDLRLYNANLFDETQEQKKEIAKKDAKIKRLRPWATLGKGVVVGVLIGSGIYIASEVAP